ncbi:hypothetical protein ACFP59_13690, partial [Microbacterium koreense]
ERDQAAALLRDAAGPDRGALTLVVTAASDTAVFGVLADAHRDAPSTLSLRAHAHSTTAEVTA